MSEFSVVSVVTSMLNLSAIDPKLSPDLTVYVFLVVTVVLPVASDLVVFFVTLALPAVFAVESSLFEITEKHAIAKMISAIGATMRAQPLDLFFAPGRLLTDAGRRRLLPPPPLEARRGAERDSLDELEAREDFELRLWLDPRRGDSPTVRTRGWRALGALRGPSVSSRFAGSIIIRRS
jgi:hypothetical protein